MILTLLTTAAMVYAVVYMLLSSLVALGEKRHRMYELPQDLPWVSIIVCARNEEQNIRRCLDHLVRVDYPRDRLEIILVDDESTDTTQAIMRQYAAAGEGITVLSTEHEPYDLAGKQRPLHLGIRKSTGDFILITDADIAVRPGWIKSHLAAYTDTIGIVGATTRVDYSSGSFFDRLQCAELVSKFSVAMGCAGLGHPLSIMGNNMSFRRTAYESIGGYMGRNRTIVEDMALMNTIVARTDYSMGWATSPDSVATSRPEKDLNTFINQRARWVYEVSDLSGLGKVLLALEVLMGTALVVSAALFAWSTAPLLVTALGWTIGYILFLAPQPGSDTKDMLFVPAVILFQFVYAFLLTKHALFNRNRIVWKGRTYTKPAAERPVRQD